MLVVFFVVVYVEFLHCVHVFPLFDMLYMFSVLHMPQAVMATIDHGFFITHNQTLYHMPRTIPAEWVSH